MRTVIQLAVGRTGCVQLFSWQLAARDAYSYSVGSFVIVLNYLISCQLLYSYNRVRPYLWLMRYLPLLLLFFACQSDPAEAPPVSYDSQGQAVLPPVDQDFDEEAKKWGFVNPKGELVIGFRFDDTREFSEGLAVVRVGGKWGYTDRSGRLAIKPQYKGAYSFKNGRARVTTLDGKWGFIGNTGQVVVPATYENAYDFEDGTARVQVAGKLGTIDADGAAVIVPEYEKLGKLENGVRQFRRDGGFYGLLRNDGEILWPADTYGRIGSYQPDGLTRVRVDRKYGFADPQGKIVLPATYGDARDFNEGRAAVAEAGKWGMIDGQGKWIVEPRYDALNYAGEGRWIVTLGELTGFLDDAGNEVVSPRYTEAHPFSEGRAAVQVDRLWGYIGRNGQMVIKPQFVLTWPFRNGQARAFFPDGVAFIDKNGHPVMAQRFFEVRDFSEGLARVQDF